MVKVGVDARPLSTPMSGVGRLIHETIKFFPNSERYEFYLFSHRPVHAHHSSILTIPNCQWIQGETFFSVKGGLYFTLELPIQIRKHKIDLFWGAQQVLPPFIPRHIPCILSYMDMVLYLYPETMRRLARWQQKLYQSYSVRRADFIVSISENTNQDMVSRFSYPEERTTVAYPGIDPINIESILAKKESSRIRNLPPQYILSVSTIEPRKNYRFLLEVFRKIRSENLCPGIQWIIAGKRGWEKKSFYRELNFDRENYNDIQVMEGLDDSELHHLYKNCSLFWMASLYEGFGIPVVEALYHGKPVLLSDIPTFREIGGDFLTYLPASSIEDVPRWVEKTLEFLQTNKKSSIDLSRFYWSYSAKKIEEVFSRILK